MKKLPKDERKLDAMTRLKDGEWRVTERVVMGKKDALENRLVVQIWYGERSMFESHGIIALESAIENVRRWIASGYIPKIPRKILGDYGSAEVRSKIARKNASGIIPKDQ